MHKDTATKAFWGLLNSVDDLSNVTGGIHYGEIREGDLAFLDTHSLEGDGYIYLAKIKDKKKATFSRLYWTDSDTITFCCATDGEIEGAYPIADVTVKGRVTGIYRTTPSTPMVDLKKHFRMMESIKSIHAGRFDMTYDEITAIKAKNKGRPLECIYDAFSWGFLKGQRCEKSRAKKARQRVKEGERNAETQS